MYIYRNVRIAIKYFAFDNIKKIIKHEAPDIFLWIIDYLKITIFNL